MRTIRWCGALPGIVMEIILKEYCKSNRNACCLLELFDLANKRSFMRPRGLLRYEQEICNVISNSIRRFAPNGEQTGRLTETGLEKLSELGNMIVNNDNVDFQRYFHPIIGRFDLLTSAADRRRSTVVLKRVKCTTIAFKTDLN